MENKGGPSAENPIMNCGVLVAARCWCVSFTENILIAGQFLMGLRILKPFGRFIDQILNFNLHPEKESCGAFELGWQIKQREIMNVMNVAVWWPEI